MFGPGRAGDKGSQGSQSPFGPTARSKIPRTAREQRRNNRASAWDDTALGKTAQFESLGQIELEPRYSGSGIIFYDVPPGCQINIETMETLAVERLRFLRVMEKHASLSSIKGSDEWRANIFADLKGQGLEAYSNFQSKADKSGKEALKVLQNRARDHFSHFILRLAYCRTEDLRRWFVAQELDAFRWRCDMATDDDIRDFMMDYDLKFTEVSTEEKDRLASELLAVQQSQYQHGLEKGLQPKYFKVHFTEALELVRKRSVLISQGYCYVPVSEMRILLHFMFKSLLIQNLALTAKVLPNLDEDDRLIRMLSDLDRRYTGDEDFSNCDGEQPSIKPEMISPLSAKGAFPMCMRSMQNALDTTHHLKYKARLQYGLFLKGVGLSLDDAIRFFRGEFTKANIPADKFDKEYTYNIRYNYGKEGKKVNWLPWNCMRIIMENVGPGENHGCPYRHHDPDVLKANLVKSGIAVGSDDLNQILQASKEGHFQKACALQFRASHKGAELSTGITQHPNQFYQESINGGPTKKKTTLVTEKVSSYDPVANQNDLNSKDEDEILMDLESGFD